MEEEVAGVTEIEEIQDEVEEKPKCVEGWACSQMANPSLEINLDFNTITVRWEDDQEKIEYLDPEEDVVW